MNMPKSRDIYNQHVLGFEALPSEDARTYHATDEEAQRCSSVLTNYIQIQNRRCIEDVLNEVNYSATELPEHLN